MKRVVITGIGIVSCLGNDKNAVIVEIKDNGSGIKEELFDKIFKPNFTTKSSGMGLGLAIVKKIIETNNGQISFISKIGIGTSFYIKLPIEDNE